MPATVKRQTMIDSSAWVNTHLKRAAFAATDIVGDGHQRVAEKHFQELAELFGYDLVKKPAKSTT